MHDLPGPVFRPKDHRHPQIEWDDLLPSAKLGLVPLYPHKVGKFSSDVLRDNLEANDLASSALGCSTLNGLSNLLPAMGGRA
jgi:hypothetical protein